jgi:hypothetical protein
MAGTDSDGRVATTLLTDWLRYLLGNARHRPITAQDLVFRDLYALVAEHRWTKGPLSELYDEIRRFADVPADVAQGMCAAVDAAAAEDPTFAVQLEELLHVLRPLTPDEPPHPKGGYFADPGLVPPVLGGGTDETDDSDHPYFATTPEPAIPVTIYLPDTADHAEVEAAVEALLATADAEITDRDTLAGNLHTLRARPATDEATMTATCLRNLGPVLAALHAHAEAILRAGALLMVKQGPRLTVQELTTAQQFRLDHEPELAAAPHHILAALESDEGFTSPA